MLWLPGPVQGGIFLGIVLWALGDSGPIEGRARGSYSRPICALWERHSTGYGRTPASDFRIDRLFNSTVNSDRVDFQVG